MALVDTGLGWWAEAQYLQSLGGEIGEIKNVNPEDFPNQPIPVFDHDPTADEIVAAGFIVGENNWENNRYYVAAFSTPDNTCKPSIFTAFWNDSDLPGFMSPDQGNFNLKIVRQNRSSQSYSIYSSYYFGSGTYNATYQLYYDRISSGPFMSHNARIPRFATLNDALQALSSGMTSTPIYKLNSGYAVRCFVKWRDFAPSTYWTPMLISTDENAIVISTDGQTENPNMARNIKQYEGVTFYIGYLRGINGDAVTDAPAFDANAEFIGPGGDMLSIYNVFALIASDEHANITIFDSPDPYQNEGESSEEGGGNGEEDEEDNVDFTDPPSTSIGATGLLTIFCPNLYQLQSLGNYMWTTFDVDNWRKIIANPMDAILGLHTLPIPAVITGTKALKVAGIDTTIDMSYTTVRYIRRSMGTCEIPKKWGAYLDYNPYTKISIFLPFIGFKELDADDIMGKTIALQYMIDILTGACVAELKCGDTVLYSWSGNCANEVPISGSDWRGAIASAISIAATVAGTALVTGGATAPMAVNMVASAGANSMNLKPTINRSGAISGSAGYMSQKRPYIIRSIPNLVIPTDQNKFIGYPSFVTASLGSLTGYNEIASIHLEGIPATGNELAEIETLLKGGVIF